MHRGYRHLFFDLDNTLWDFTTNSKLALQDVYNHYNLQRYYSDFKDYFEQFELNNTTLWRLYGTEKITKDVLSVERFLAPLRPFGILNSRLASDMSRLYLDACSAKTTLMPHTLDVLDYLKPRYAMHIISNGFSEVQYKKLELSGLSGYFSTVFLSEEVGCHKPKAGFFAFMLAKTAAQKEESLVVGDNYETDIEGAMNCGLDQVFYSPTAECKPEQHATYIIADLLELCGFL